MNRILTAAFGAALAISLAPGAQAETRITYKSAKSTSSYYQMAVQIAEAMKAGTGRRHHRHRGGEPGLGPERHGGQGARGDYVFTTPPVLVKLAQGGKAMFKDKGDPKFDEIRALFPIPP